MYVKGGGLQIGLKKVHVVVFCQILVSSTIFREIDFTKKEKNINFYIYN